MGPDLAQLRASQEATAALIDKYARANFLDEHGKKAQSSAPSRDDILRSVTQRYGAINAIAHRTYEVRPSGRKKCGTA